MSDPVPVLLMTRELGLGGSERQLTETAKALDRRRWRPFVGCFQGGGMRAEELRRAGVPVVEFPVRSFLHLSTLQVGRRMGKFLAEEKIQLVHSFDVPANLFAVPTGWFYRTPVVLSSQRAYRDLTPGVHRKLLRVTDRLVDGIVVNCEAMKRHLEEDEGVRAERIHVCYNGLDLKALTAPARVSGEELTVGVVCALRPEKGLPTLVEAFARVYRGGRVRRPLRLLIVGSGPVLGALQKQSEELGIAGVCHFEPATAQVPEWLARIDVFVLPSLSEALSNSLMEAMACGCAAVASRVGGNTELVREGETGLTFAAGDAEGLAGQLERLLLEDELRQRVAERGARLIREQFCVEAACRRMEEIYGSLLKFLTQNKPL